MDYETILKDLIFDLEFLSKLAIPMGKNLVVYKRSLEILIDKHKFNIELHDEK